MWPSEKLRITLTPWIKHECHLSSYASQDRWENTSGNIVYVEAEEEKLRCERNNFIPPVIDKNVWFEKFYWNHTGPNPQK